MSREKHKPKTMRERVYSTQINESTGKLHNLYIRAEGSNTNSKKCELP